MRSTLCTGLLATALTLSAGGCATVRGWLEPGPPAVLVDVPTGAFLGMDRMLRPPDSTDGRFEHVAYPEAENGSRRLAAGETALLLDLEGPGVVRRLRFELASADPHALRRISLRMYWDEETEPSVDVPLGDFFGDGFERSPYAALPMAVTGDAFNVYLPMPFARRARIVLENGTDLPLEAIAFDADVELDATLSEPVATFHATWTRDPRGDSERPHRVVDLRGSGWYVGTTLSAQGYDGSLSFLEGAGTFKVDGRAVRGSPSRAYLAVDTAAGGATLAGPFQGVALRDTEQGRIAAYRWHLPDPIPFRESFTLDLERGRANAEAADYATVGYWYQVEPHRPLPPLPRPFERRVPDVLIPPDAVFRDELDLKGTGGGTMRVTVPVPRPDRYEVVVFPEAAPGAATPTVSVVGQGGRARAIDVSPPGAEPGQRLPGVVVDTARVTGRAAELELAARGGGIPLPAAVQLRPLRAWAAPWWAVGPWAADEPGRDPGAALDSLWGPEADPDPDRVYALPTGGTVSWRPADAERAGYVGLGPAGPRGGATAYAQAFLYAPDDRPATLLLELENPYRLWLDGAVVGEARVPPSGHGPLEIPVFLHAGWSRVLLKVAAADGAGRFRLRAADPTGELAWARSR